MQSIGNDFPLFLASDVRAAGWDATPVTLATVAARLADRRFGIGGDGVLILDRSPEALHLRMFNPDGTEDFCGNGLRCAAMLIHREGWAGDAFTIQHLGQEVACHVEGGKVSTTIGAASYDPDKVPVMDGPIFNSTVWNGMDEGWPLNLFGSALTTGSTHVVIPTDALPDDESFASISPKIETDPRFPERTSVIWRKELGPMRLQIRIWERGVGETQGCGTGSGAAAADYLRRKQMGGTVEVLNPGGAVIVRAESWDRPLTVEGQAEITYRGEFLDTLFEGVQPPEPREFPPGP